MALKYAKTIEQILPALNNKPLELSEIEIYFEETSDARDPELRRRDKIAHFLEAGTNIKILVAGQSGSGKSTELVKFQEEHNSKYAFVTFSISEEGQLTQASTEALLVLIIEAITRKCVKLGIKLDDKMSQAIYGWFEQSYHIKEEDLEFTLAGGTDVDTRRTFWDKLVGLGAFLKSDIRAGSHRLHKTTKEDDKRLSELVSRCNLLIREAKLSFQKEIRKEFVLIVEDLDKITIQAAGRIFLDNPAPLVDLDCKAIFTVPIWLYCNPRSLVLESQFKRVNIPMIKTLEKDGSKCISGQDTLIHLLKRRMDVSSLLDDNAMLLAIGQTGGVLRHLFDTLTEAAMTAQQRNKKKDTENPSSKIAEADIRYGLGQLKNKLISAISEVGLPKEFVGQDITVEKMKDRLRELRGKHGHAQSDHINLLLIFAQALIEYNGTGWHRVHPLVEEWLDES